MHENRKPPGGEMPADMPVTDDALSDPDMDATLESRHETFTKSAIRDGAWSSPMRPMPRAGRLFDWEDIL